ncbi:MAG TPA: class I tRNA ligase family protein, partial [Polyangiaceae bacterium]
RTWAFYTIAKAHLHEDSVPWHNVMISGWILDPDRKKMAKSKGNVVTPVHLFDEFGVDAVRYWAASARLGADTAFDEKVFKIGRRLVTKLFNAGKFVLAQSGPVAPVTHELDRAFVAELAELVTGSTRQFEEFKFAQVLHDTETFFWTRFTDTFIELSKPRAWGDDAVSAEARGSALTALRLGLGVLLRLFAPFLPYITEEVWSWVFAKESGQASIHTAPWPSEADFAGIAPPQHADSFGLSVACFEAINKAKSDASVSTGRVVKELVVAANPETLARALPVLDAAFDAARCELRRTEADATLEAGTFAVRHAIFAEKSA